MKPANLLLSDKEETEIPDKTFPMNSFHVGGSIGTIIPPHWHDHLEWIAVVRGGFRVQVDTRFEDLYEGDAAFVHARQVHSAVPIGEGCELYAVVFNEALLRNSSLDNTEAKYIMPLLQGEIQPQSFYQSGTDVTARIHGCIVRMARLNREQGFGYELLVKAALYEALGCAIRHADVAEALPGNRRYPPLIQPLLLYLSQHVHESISVERAAQMCCVSPNYFCYMFKKATGKTLLEYVNMLRIHQAEQLLRTRRYSIQQVALMVGYSNMTYFGRVFKKLKNQTPSEYMKAVERGDAARGGGKATERRYSRLSACSARTYSSSYDDTACAAVISSKRLIHNSDNFL